jgi:hypothetical protein
MLDVLFVLLSATKAAILDCWNEFCVIFSAARVYGPSVGPLYSGYTLVFALKELVS